MKKLIVGVVLFWALTAIASAQVNQEWTARFNGSGNQYDYARAVVADASGNVYVTGYSYTYHPSSGYTNYDIATVKYNSAGVQQWVRTFEGTYPTGSDQGRDIALDGAGNVYVAGYCYDNNGSINYDIVVIKYDPAGNQLWARTYNGPYNSTDYGYALAVDAAGNSYVTGYAYVNLTTYADIVLIKYDPSGNQQWVQFYAGTANSSDYGYDVTLDGSGNPHVAGMCYNNNAGYNSSDCVTLKYNTSGVLQWAKSYNNPGYIFASDYGYGVAVDGSGNVYTCGYTYPGTNYDYLLIKYNAAGTEQWVRTYNGSGNSYDYGYYVKCNSAGDVWIAGRAYEYHPATGSYNDDIVTVKYNTSGVQQWVYPFNGPKDYYDNIWSASSGSSGCLALDASNNCYVTGYTYGPPDYQNDYVTFKLNSGGSQQWVQYYDGGNSPPNTDQTVALAIDDANNVYVTGNSYWTSSYYDYLTIKYSQSAVVSADVYVKTPLFTGTAYSATQLWAGASYTPTDTTGNNGPANANNVNAKVTIGAYTNTQSLGTMASGAKQLVNYTIWTASRAPGTALSRTDNVTTTSSDPNPANNSVSWSGSTVYDGQAVSIDNLPDTLYTGLTYNPQATVKNNSGAGAADFSVTSQITPGGSPGTINVTNLAAGATTQITLAPFVTPKLAGSVDTVTVTVQITGDINTANNTVRKIVYIKGDAGVVDGLDPLDTVYVNTSYNPVGRIMNFTPGFTVPFNIVCQISDDMGGIIYTDTRNDSLGPNEEKSKYFKEWLVGSDPGVNYELDVFTQLPGDFDATNDHFKWTVVSALAPQYDAGVVSIDNPTGQQKFGTSTMIKATVKNYGTQTATFDVLCICESDTVRRTVTGLAKNASRQVDFFNWTADALGDCSIFVKTLLQSDAYPANDTLTTIITVVGVDEKPLPTAYNLDAARPNPVSTWTTVSYALPENAVVALGVYDITGKLVKTLVSGSVAAGNQSVRWDGRDNAGKPVANGLYFVRMVTRKYTAVKKVVLTR